MPLSWAHTGTSVLASFLASLVECVEALTVVLAVSTVRGWRPALAGCGAALAVLGALVALLGPALVRVPLPTIQLVVGTLLLLFGLRWLRKAVLRSAGQIALHDEAGAFAKNTAALTSGAAKTGAWDKVAAGTAFNITMLEGTEVIFIVIAIGSGGTGLLAPAAIGALAALALVIALGLLLHRPLAQVPENTLKYAVGVLLSAFGTFWVGEGLGLSWPGEDWSIPGLVLFFLALAFALTAITRTRPAGAARELR